MSAPNYLRPEQLFLAESAREGTQASVHVLKFAEQSKQTLKNKKHNRYQKIANLNHPVNLSATGYNRSTVFIRFLFPVFSKELVDDAMDIKLQLLDDLVFVALMLNGRRLEKK